MEKEYYGKNYDKAMENIRKEQSKMRADFLKKYPNADISKFEFDVTLKRNGDVDSTAIYFKNSDILSTDIKRNTFLNGKISPHEYGKIFKNMAIKWYNPKNS